MHIHELIIFVDIFAFIYTKWNEKWTSNQNKIQFNTFDWHEKVRHKNLLFVITILQWNNYEKFKKNVSNIFLTAAWISIFYIYHFYYETFFQIFQMVELQLWIELCLMAPRWRILKMLEFLDTSNTFGSLDDINQCFLKYLLNKHSIIIEMRSINHWKTLNFEENNIII